MQLEFLWYELSTNYKKSVLTPILSAASILEASNIILLHFEAPASKDEIETQEKRAKYSQEYYDRFHVEPPKPEIKEPAEENESESTLPENVQIDEETSKEVGNLFVQCLNTLIKIFKLIFKRN